MDLEGKTVWQVAAGDNRRKFADMCLQYDVMMIGPGDLGPFDEKIYAHLTSYQRNVIRRFHNEPRIGHVALLRLGSREVRAVGVVAEQKPAHVEEFGDIDGWRLQHTWRVRWTEARKPFPRGTFRRRFGRVSTPKVLRWLSGFEFPEGARDRPLKRLPPATPKVTDEELVRQLLERGFPAEQAAKLATTLGSTRRLVEWYKSRGESLSGRPSEHETITYLVIPFLLGLGWSQETVAIEWNHIDIVLFEEAPAEHVKPVCPIEVKSFGRSIIAPSGQARDYALRLDCTRYVVTDGVRYSVFEKGPEDFCLRAYLNITRLRNSYPVYDEIAEGQCGGAVETILGMAKGSP